MTAPTPTPAPAPAPVTPDTPPRAPDDTGPAAFLRRRTGLVVPVLLAVTGVVLGAGTLTMEVPANVASPGPRMFPTVVAIACLVFAVLTTVDVLRNPEPEHTAPAGTTAAGTTAAGTTAAGTTTVGTTTVGTTAADTAPGGTASGDTAPSGTTPAEPIAPVRPRSNHLAVAGLVGTVVAFIALLEPLGWLISGALLFWGVARALGSRRTVFDAFLSVAISSTVQLAFSAGLGLNLPPGILAGVF
ncbi:tripartite tricarboxylate transporter TctB family protein [Streptomyces sp. NPDC093085]|uniref:tripartite tricarboxylate transporter TctB family protein n=1 Tax=Streptomyces sp. NPDC093085 TaxID=3155068 RepID=UPI003413370C